MTTLRFTDGMEFDTSGPLRPVKRSDGWYVAGNGLLMPVNDYAEAQEVIKEENDRHAQK